MRDDAYAPADVKKNTIHEVTRNDTNDISCFFV